MLDGLLASRDDNLDFAEDLGRSASKQYEGWFKCYYMYLALRCYICIQIFYHVVLCCNKNTLLLIHTNFISNYYPKLRFGLLRVSVTYCSHHQGPVIL